MKDIIQILLIILFSFMAVSSWLLGMAWFTVKYIQPPVKVTVTNMSDSPTTVTRTNYITITNFSTVTTNR